MKIVASRDIQHVESLLLARLEGGAERNGPVRARLVLVPTARLALYLKRRILEHHGAALGVHILTHHGFATRVLQHALVLPPRILPAVSLTRILGAALDGLPRDEASYLRHHAGARQALASTFEELREATIDASRLRDIAPRDVPSWLPAAYARFEADLELMQKAGWVDAPGLLRQALPHAESFLRRKSIDAVFHYGAYELTGANVRLVEHLDRIVEVEFLLPCAIDRPAHVYAERFARLLARRGATIVPPAAETAPSTIWNRRLRALYAPETRSVPESEATTEIASAPRKKSAPRKSPPAPSGGQRSTAGSTPTTQLDWIADAPRIGRGEEVAAVRSDDVRKRNEPRTEPSVARAGNGSRGAARGARGIPRLELRHTQGTQAELTTAALRALTLHHREGVPWDEIAIVARSLEPYAPSLQPTFDRLGVPFTTSARLPLSRAPGVSTFLEVLRVYARDFERGAVIALLRHGGLRLREAPAPTDIDRWDRWSREGRVVRGLSHWRALSSSAPREEPGGTDTDDRMERRASSLAKLLDTLTDLARDAEAWEGAKTLDEHATVLATIARRRLASRDPDSGSVVDARAGRSEPAEAASRESFDGNLQRLFTILDSLRDAQRAVGASSEVLSRQQVLAWVEEALCETSLPIGDDDTGVRVLDLMQARGLTHRVVQWLGFHHGGFPRVGRSDPYLPDSARAALRDATVLPLGYELEAATEERLLLSLTLESVRELLCLSSQRADEAGRKRARSTALREIARVFTGRADVKHLARAAKGGDDGGDSACGFDDLPVHCGERARLLAASPRFGILPPEDVVTAVAVNARAPIRQTGAALKTLRLVSPETDAALEWLGHIEDFSFHAESGPFDALTGRGIDPDRELSPTALEHLTGCPQAFFLRYVLGVRELDEEAEPHRIELRLLGTAVHETLERLYGELQSRGLFLRSQREAIAAALELLPAYWKAALEGTAGPSLRRLRGLLRLLGERWLDSLSRFVVRDLETIVEAAVETIAFERSCHAAVRLSDGTQLMAFGRFDRVLEVGRHVFVDDYKTAGNLPAKTSVTNFLQGRNLQLPLYREIVAQSTGTAPEGVQARCLGVGPEFEATRPAVATLKWDPKARDGFLETLAVCVRLARSGRFPLNPQSARCSYCTFRSTCRRSHEPTLERLAGSPELNDYFDLRGKTKRETTLEGVRRKRPISRDQDSSASSGSEKCRDEVFPVR